ncbi:unnamed protein product [Zymoseptoria tritici ST99CH_3D1]|nr:unnamed protein product [Zymoseptoria tritici ST99CH_3D1]
MSCFWTLRIADHSGYLVASRCGITSAWWPNSLCRSAAQRRWRSKARRDGAGAYKSSNSRAESTSPSCILPITAGDSSKRIKLTEEPTISVQSSQDIPDKFSDKAHKKAYYRYYLRNAYVKPSKVESPGDWLLDLKVPAIEKLLPAHLCERPLDFFSDRSIDLRTAQKCLELHVAKGLVASQDKGLQLKRFRACRGGVIALNWLLIHYDDADLSDNTGFLKPLIHCLVAEKPTDLIWHWLKVEHIPTALSTQPWKERVAWRSAVLRFLVESQVYWDQDDKGINLALETLSHAWSIRFADESRRGDMVLPKTLTSVWVMKQLLLKGASATADPNLYDDFIFTLRFWIKDPVNREHAVSKMMLRHPSKASAQPTLDFLRHYCAKDPRPSFLCDLFNSWAGYGYLVNCAQWLNEAGDTAAACWVLDVARAEMPEYFSMRARFNDTDARPLLGAAVRPLQDLPPVGSERWDRRKAYIDSGGLK